MTSPHVHPALIGVQFFLGPQRSAGKGRELGRRGGGDCKEEGVVGGWGGGVLAMCAAHRAQR